MQKTILLLGLLSLTLSLTTIASSGTGIKIVNPVGSPTVESTKLNAEYPDVIKGSKWIWADSGVKTGKKVVTFEYLTYLDCTGNLTLSAAAYGFWKVYWDGVAIISSSSWQVAINYTIEPSCGSHNLTIVVNKSDSSDYAGLVFLLQQNTTDCYNCNSNGFWSDQTCKCECLTTSCTCPDNRKWNGYPVCACKCPPRFPIFTSNLASRNLQVVAQVNTAALWWGCPAGQYYDQIQCKCLCKEKWCPYKYYFDKDPKVCDCWPIIY